MNELTPNLIFNPNFLDSSEATRLFLLLEETVLWNDKMASRYTASFGMTYDYSGMNYEELAMPQPIQQLASTIAELLGYMPNNCLLNYYLNGSSKMGFHSDDVSQLAEGTGVSIVSLGVARNILFKNKQLSDSKVSYHLNNGSLIYMDDKVQNDWLHSIPKSDTQLGRISITFRKLINS